MNVNRVIALLKDLEGWRDYDGLLRRIAERTEESGDCLLWTGAKSAAGYGQLRHEGQTWYVHRLAFVLFVGPLDDGLELDHLCRQRACWRPDHLEQVPHAENVRRGEGGWPDTARARGIATNKAKAAARTHCGNGHRWTPENTYVYPHKRVCKACLRDYKRRRRAGLL